MFPQVVTLQLWYTESAALRMRTSIRRTLCVYEKIQITTTCPHRGRGWKTTCLSLSNSIKYQWQRKVKAFHAFRANRGITEA